MVTKFNHPNQLLLGHISHRRPLCQSHPMTGFMEGRCPQVLRRNYPYLLARKENRPIHLLCLKKRKDTLLLMRKLSWPGYDIFVLQKRSFLSRGVKMTGNSSERPIEFKVQVIIEPDEGEFHAYCPALKGLHVPGKTKEEALANAKEAAALYLETLIENNLPIPLTVTGPKRLIPVASPRSGVNP